MTAADPTETAQPVESAEPMGSGESRAGVNAPAVLVAALVAALVVAAMALASGGAITTIAPGLPDPGPITPWALPFAKVVAQLLAAVTVGALAAAVFALPARVTDSGRTVSAHGYRLMRIATYSAAGWALATLVQLCFTISDLLGQPVEAALTNRTVLSFVTSIDQGRALVIVIIGAAAIAIVTRLVLSPTACAILVIASIVTATPPVLTGHAASSANHQLAVSTMLLHVCGVLLWTGGLIALLLVRRLPHALLVAAVDRYSSAALVCYAVVGVSGAANAWLRINRIGELVTSPYGIMVSLKLAALILLGVFGWLHRRRTLPRLATGERGAFFRLAAVEVLVFTATIGLAVGLSRTPPVAGEDTLTGAGALLGFPMPGPVTIPALLFDWLPEPLFCTAALAAAGLYLAGVRRLRRRGDSWPVARTVSWLAGWALVVLATSSGVARYGYVLFSMHMIQHMTLAMLVPVLLVLGGPITLALRALRPSPDEAMRGPREWLLLIIHSRLAHFFAHPLVALAIYVTSFYSMYFTGLYDAMLRSHVIHLLTFTHFIVAGTMFFWIIVGIDPAPRPLPYPIRIPLLFVSMVFHAFFGVALMQTTTLMAADWYNSLTRTWGSSPLDDQQVGAGIAWAFGEIPTVVIIGALFLQWVRSDEREQRRLDRAADRSDARALGADSNSDDSDDADALAAYNRRLRALADADNRNRLG